MQWYDNDISIISSFFTDSLPEQTRKSFEGLAILVHLHTIYSETRGKGDPELESGNDIFANTSLIQTHDIYPQSSMHLILPISISMSNLVNITLASAA